MKSFPLVLFTTICIISSANSQDTIYSPTIKTSITGSVYDIEYSPDQEYIAMAQSSYIQLYDEVSVFPLGSINYGTNFAFSSFSFSQDSASYAVGFSAGDGSTLVKVYNTSNNKVEPLTITVSGKENAVLTVNSVCFTADNKRLIYSTSEGYIYSYRFTDKSTTKIQFGDIPASSIACSPSRSLEFAAAGSNPSDGRKSKFKLYNINPETN